jgi:hypothetical protein
VVVDGATQRRLRRHANPYHQTETITMNQTRKDRNQKAQDQNTSVQKTPAHEPGQGKSQEEDRGSGARKVELEKRLDANADLEAKAAGGKRAKTREEEEAAIDEALEESFPASDSPAPAVPKRGQRRMG